MASRPLVSIIVPVYNVQEYLPRCLDSLSGQSLENIEIICLDDGSTDDCPHILADYTKKEARLKVRRQDNQGVASARNEALTMASGSYVAFVDPDDWLEPETCEVAAALLQADHEIDYVAWNTKVHSAAPSILNRKQVEETEKLYNVRYKGRQAINNEIKLNTVPNVCNKMLKTEIIRKYEIIFPDCLIAEDGAFWHKYAAHAGYGYYLDRPFYNYFRGRSDSLSWDIKNKHYSSFNWFDTFEDICAHYKKYSLITEDGSIYLAHLFADMYISEFNNAVDEDTVRREGLRLIEQYQLPESPGDLIYYIKRGRHHALANYSLWEKLFSVKNSNQFKILKIFGLEFKFKRRA